MKAVQKVKAFPYVFFHSLTSPPYYRDILKTNTAFSFKYFFTLAGLASLVVTLSLTYKVTPAVEKALNSTLNGFIKAYPDDLEITGKDNEWHVNKPEPLNIKTPDIQGAGPIALPRNFITFDKQGTLDDIAKYDTLVLVNSKNILVQNNTSRAPSEWSGKIDVYPIKEVPTGKFTKDSLIKAVDNIQSLTGFFEMIVILVMGLFIFVYNYVFRLFYLLIVALYVWALSGALGLKFKPMDSYKISMHSITLPIIVELILTTTGLTLNMPMWFLAINMIFVSVVVLFLAKSEHRTTKEQPAK